MLALCIASVVGGRDVLILARLMVALQDQFNAASSDSDGKLGREEVRLYFAVSRSARNLEIGLLHQLKEFCAGLEDPSVAVDKVEAALAQLESTETPDVLPMGFAGGYTVVSYELFLALRMTLFRSFPDLVE